MKRKAERNLSIAEVAFPNDKLVPMEGPPSVFAKVDDDQQQKSQYHHRRPGVVMPCLYPRDDLRSRVRFTPVLCVYDHFEDDDCDNCPEINHSVGMVEEKAASDNKQALFLLRRAFRCWYSREELKMIKDECKSILNKVHFDTDSLDETLHETRGLESYLSPGARETNRRRRKAALLAILNEQYRQQQSPGGQNQDADQHIQHVSQSVSEWFRNRALERAKQDAKDAAELYGPSELRILSSLCNTGMKTDEMELASIFHESLHESIGLMDIDDYDKNNRDCDDPTLRYWAESSWTTTVLMEE